MKKTKPTHSLTGAATTLALLLGASGAQAAPVLFSGTGHYYEHISGTFTWTQAQAAAAAQTFNGEQGYLTTVTSAAENSFLATLATDGWLGGTDQAVEGTWVWAGGPEAGTVFWNGGTGGSSPTFASWNSGEPNNLGGENYLQYQNGGWNDLPNNPYSFGYFVEFNAASTVPEPAVLSLLALGLAGIGVARRRC